MKQQIWPLSPSGTQVWKQLQEVAVRPATFLSVPRVNTSTPLHIAGDQRDLLTAANGAAQLRAEFAQWDFAMHG